MRHTGRWMTVAALIIVAAVQLSACAGPSASSAANQASGDPPATVERLAGTELARVTLTAQAAKRLDIQTAPVRDTQVRGTLRKVVPYSAILYDLHGGTWVYTAPDPLTFVRTQVGVDFIEGDLAVLTEGPPTGAAVVTVGAPELYGTESGVGE